MLVVQSISLCLQPLLFLCATLLLLPPRKFIVSASADDATDAASLLAFKSAVEDDPLGALRSWNVSLHFCKWQGITCGRRHQRLIVLNLTSKHLVGSISPSLGNLTFLKHLYLEANNFRGSIPEEIGRLTRLQSLFLGDNSLEGEIPRNLSRCSNLINLRLNRNKLVGNFPTQILSIYGLKRLGFRGNNIRGEIPSAIANLTSLEILSIGFNMLEGSIPSSIGRMKSMKLLILGPNRLSGALPPSFYNLSSIEIISLVANRLHGSLSPNIGQSFPNLVSFYLGMNNFSGPIPLSFSNASSLVDLDLIGNNFFGKVGVNFGELKNLGMLILGNNSLGNGGDTHSLDFLNSLPNCTRLFRLDIYGNGFRSVIPSSFANLSTQLTVLDFSFNWLFGEIPSAIGKFENLNLVMLQGNEFKGQLPMEMGKLKKLEGLTAAFNTLTGEIPETLGNLTSLVGLDLQDNKFHGTIPASIGNCKRLTFLSFQKNNLSGIISKQVFSLTLLGQFLDLSQNQLSGELPPEIGNLKILTSLILSHNEFSGTLPNELGNCESLEYLSMQGNNFHGPIPSSFRSLRGMRQLDLSSNNLSGQIPNYFSEFSLNLLNLSFNNFDGKVPIGGVFSNVSAVSLLGNTKLCGGASFLNLPVCAEAKRRPKLTRKLKIIISVFVILLGLASLLFLLFLMHAKKMRRKPKESELVSKPSLFMSVSYGDLLHATNNFSSDNLIGKGYFSSVYKGIFEQDGQTVAIKVLNLQLHGAVRSFTAECEALRTVRHRNLLKTITSCSTIDFKGNDFKAIVYEFMPGGSLDSWLHHGSDDREQGRFLNLLQRVNIAIDVALALDYLHHRCHITIVHCDLKPSNILLDESLSARVGDFGLAKLITNYTKISESSSIVIRGTIGYAAPEYGQGSEVSSKGDIYSYGIILLEMTTGKRPTDMIFVGGLNLHSYVDKALSSEVIDIVDSVLLSSMRPTDQKLVNCLVPLLKLGVACSMESPRDRMEIDDVITQLQMIKTTVLSLDHQE